MSLVMTLTVGPVEAYCMREGLVSTRPQTRIRRIPAALGQCSADFAGRGTRSTHCRHRIVSHLSRDQHLMGNFSVSKLRCSSGDEQP